MVGFLHDQKDNVHFYQVNWPENTVQLGVLPKNLWVDQGHTSNGVAGYGFFLGLFGMFVAFRQRKRAMGGRSKTLLALVVLLFLAVLFTLSALIFVFLVTNQTKGQHISEAIAGSSANYPANRWTPETWFKAVLELPLADNKQRDKIDSNVTNMEAWRWMLIPIFLTDIACFSIALLDHFKQKRGVQSEFTMEK
ncbi:hypothetical protein EJ04DRAFT_469882 [Polyplosphaeria fusca]|uniref:Uncharacterized protein n=1 Tax=Polyplosphaeria fusca TaxID=682080 RepID=A0A9P4UXZ6_9PLEO|nr:hypothetical protein EJ04DRAFT_469882 [Polyplosphaeria fusca]